MRQRSRRSRKASSCSHKEQGMASSEALALLKRFYELQEERVQTYALFNEGHQAYLTAAPNYNFPMYRQLVHEVTETFRKISSEIMEIEKELKDKHSLSEISKFVGLVQDDEKCKLELTAKMQIAKQNVIDHEDVASYRDDVDDLEKQIRDVVERINEHMEELKYESEDLILQ